MWKHLYRVPDNHQGLGKPLQLPSVIKLLSVTQLQVSPLFVDQLICDREPAFGEDVGRVPTMQEVG